jgi:multidrug efflux pump subunit AcrA (membrane-fusion protein)
VFDSLRAVRRWPVVVVGIVVLAVAGGGAAWAMGHSSGTTSPSSQVVAAKIATINQTVSASGTIAPAKEADLAFAATGRVTSVRVQQGEEVAEGQTLATLGTAALQATTDAARATVASAEDSVAEASTSTDLTAARSALVAAESQLKTAKRALADAHLKATISGTVTSVDLTKGQQVSGTSATTTSGSASTGSDSTAASTTTSNSSQVVIQSTKSYLVNATVDDTDVKTVKKGQRAAVTPDGATSSVSGTVTSVSAIPSTASDVVTFPIVVAVAGHPSGLYAGASATLAITTKHVANVLEIPTLAITYNGSAATVKVRDGSSTTTRSVTVGTSYGLETQVLSGLSSGEKVVVTIPTFAGRPPGSGSGGSTGGTFTPGGEGGFGSGGFGTGGPGAFSGQG